MTDDGPAFPTNNGPDRFNTAGMSLRDYFAAKAMQGLMANSGGPVQASGPSGWCDGHSEGERPCIT